MVSKNGWGKTWCQKKVEATHSTLKKHAQGEELSHFRGQNHIQTGGQNPNEHLAPSWATLGAQQRWKVPTHTCPVYRTNTSQELKSSSLGLQPVVVLKSAQKWQLGPSTTFYHLRMRLWEQKPVYFSQNFAPVSCVKHLWCPKLERFCPHLCTYNRL